MTKARVILAVVFLANLIMYGVYRTVQQNRRQQSAVSVTVENSPSTAAVPSPKAAATAVAAPAEAEKASADSALARAHRVAGLAALEGGDYVHAVKEFTAALRLGESGTDTAELLRIAKDLQDKAVAREAQARAEGAAAPVAETKREAEKPHAHTASAKPAAAPARKKSGPVVVAKGGSAANERDGASGVLLVTSTPSGLLVEVDGRRVDFTPTRMKVEAGLHTVAIIQGDTRLYERKVEVAEDGVHSLDPDLTEKLRPLPREEPKPALAPAAAIVAELAAPEPAAAAPAETARVAPAPNPTTPTGGTGGSANTPALRAFGELHVLSTTVYGDVWINGEAYGKPPLVARNIPSGPATIEVRVNGSVRRTKVVEVEPTKRTTIRLR
ncbi:MAG: PEGA domain-containing protein [Myxococcaceae bacterium]